MPKIIARVATTTRDFPFHEKALNGGTLIAALIMSGMAKIPTENSALGWQSDTVANPATLKPK
ncbi:hypothetical protein Pcatena_12060 [Parolsenella catena]|uniref:Uncharacterized protein n=1 Tax=Parolsenella catena TaxID=2003188 RepID=A0A3G9K8P8_9ACTN|nr:hypothetical protein Pcatena_12060 [Parolsenella catena]